MDDIFKILRSDRDDADDGAVFRIGLDIRIGGRDVQWPLSEACSTREELAREIDAAKEALDRILEQAERLFGQARGEAESGISPDMSAEEAWEVLAAIGEEAAFAASFNALDIDRRRDVAEHVLTQCNVFSGRPALFSARFDTESALIR